MLKDADYFIALKARQFQAARKYGTPYQNGSERGYLHLGRRWAVEIVSPVITGRNYKPLCECTNPPWEDCQHTLAA